MARDLEVDLKVKAEGAQEIKNAESNILKLTETLQKLNAAGKDTSGIKAQIMFFQELINQAEKATGALSTAEKQLEEFQAKQARSASTVTKRSGNTQTVENFKRDMAEMDAAHAQAMEDMKQREIVFTQDKADRMQKAAEQVQAFNDKIAASNARAVQRVAGAGAVTNTSVLVTDVINAMHAKPAGDQDAHVTAWREKMGYQDPDKKINSGSTAFNPENAEKFGDNVGRSMDSAGHHAMNLAAVLKHLVSSFDEISRHQIGALFSTIGATARDAGLGVAGLGGSVAVLSVIFAARLVGEGASKFAKMAEETRDAAAAAGMSISQFSSLQAALQMTGMKADQADSTLRQFGEHVAEAISNPSSKAAKALNALGLSNDYLKNNINDMHAIFLKASDGLSGYANNSIKAEAMQVLFGKGAEKIGDLTERGSKGISSLENEAKRLGVVLDDTTTKSLTDTGNAIDHLGAVIEGQSLQTFAKWGTVIRDVTGFLEGLTIATGDAMSGIATLVGNMTDLEGKSGHWAMRGGRNRFLPGPDPDAEKTDGKGYYSMMRGHKVWHDAPQPAPTAAPSTPKPGMAPFDPNAGPKSNFESMALVSEQMDVAGTKALIGQTTVAAQSTARLKAEILSLQSALKDSSLKLTSDDKLHLQGQLAEKQAQLVEDTTRIQAKAARQSYTDFAANERNKIAEAGNDSTAIISIYNEWANAAKSIYNQDKTTFENIQTAKTKAVQVAARAQAKEQIQAILDQVKGTSTYDAAIVTQQKVSKVGRFGADDNKDQTTADEASAQDIVKKAQETIALLQTYMSKQQPGSEAALQAQDAINQVVKETEDSVLQLYKDSGVASSGIAGFFKTMFSSLDTQSAQFSDSFIKAIVAPQQELIKAGLTTIKINLRGQELRQAAGNFFIGMANDLVAEARKGLIQLAGQQLLKIPMVQDLAQKLMPDSLAKFGLDKATQSGFGSAVKSATGAANPLGQASTIASGQVRMFGAVVMQVNSSLRGLIGSTTAAGSAHQVNAASVHASSSAHMGHVGAVMSSTVAHLQHAGAVMLSTLQHILHAAQVALDTIATELDIVMKVALAGFEGGGVVPSAAGGMVTGSTGGARLAILHAKEMVLPAHLSEGVQRAINGGSLGQGGGQGGGNSTTNHNNNASLNYSPQITMGRGGSGSMSRNELSSMLQNHASSLMGEARGMFKKGWRP